MLQQKWQFHGEWEKKKKVSVPTKVKYKKNLSLCFAFSVWNYVIITLKSNIFCWGYAFVQLMKKHFEVLFWWRWRCENVRKCLSKWNNVMGQMTPWIMCLFIRYIYRSKFRQPKQIFVLPILLELFLNWQKLFGSNPTWNPKTNTTD